MHSLFCFSANDVSNINDKLHLLQNFASLNRDCAKTFEDHFFCILFHTDLIFFPNVVFNVSDKMWGGVLMSTVCDASVVSLL